MVGCSVEMKLNGEHLLPTGIFGAELAQSAYNNHYIVFFYF